MTEESTKATLSTLPPKLKSPDQVIEQEEQLLRIRREKLGKESPDALTSNRFGIALSGGGIRSATINLGLLKTLNLFGILERADYISSVSGGGYTGAYVQATLKNQGDTEALFHEDHIEYMRSRGEYMIPGKGYVKMWNRIILVVGYLISLLMSWIAPIIVGLLLYGAYLIFGELLPINTAEYVANRAIIYKFGIPILIGIFALHYLFNVLLNYDLNVSSYFNLLETGLIAVAFAVFIGLFVASFEIGSINTDRLLYYAFGALVLIILGFFANPNATSFHRFYRKRLADAFLNDAGEFKNVLLKDLFQLASKKNDYIAPYPLINTCLNLQSTKQKDFIGTKTNDYFLLSPMYCGSKLTGYVSTSQTKDYEDLTLPAAATISAAAVNPGMGIYSNKILSILTTIFNARLGYWILNPLQLKKSKPAIWWPRYFFYELFSQIGTENEMLNISDGGHIENLGVYELLRRKCRLIIAVDAGADPEFSFTDLENLTVRARNELGLAIRFREGQSPEDIIRPKPSHGYSEKRFAVADVYQIWEEMMVPDGNGGEKEVLINYPTDEQVKISTLVYVKSSVTAPEGKPYLSPEELDLNTIRTHKAYKYKIYHPSFPHEPTSDQFFDPTQWDSYYILGQYIGADILGIDNLLSIMKGEDKVDSVSINQLISHFDFNEDLTRPGYIDEDETVADDVLDSVTEPSMFESEMEEEEPPAILSSREASPTTAPEEESIDTIDNETEEEINIPTSSDTIIISTDTLIEENITPKQLPKEKVVVGKKVDYKM